MYRLKWYLHVEAKHEREQGTPFYLCPVDIELIRVHVIRSNALVYFLHDTVPYNKSLRDHFKSPTEWQN